jgi:hypothetical protein
MNSATFIHTVKILSRLSYNIVVSDDRTYFSGDGSSDDQCYFAETLNDFNLDVHPQVGNEMGSMQALSSSQYDVI